MAIILNEKFWEKYFGVYDVLQIAIPYQKLLEMIEHKLNLQLDDVVLDVGSGTGNLAVKIKKKCQRVIGIDYSEAGATIHKKKDPGAEIVIRDINQGLPFPDNFFSKVVSINTIYTLTPGLQRKVMLEILRVLRPRGKFVVVNVKKDYKPLEVYLDHVTKSFIKDGLFKTLWNLLKIMMPTLKMFYFSSKIKRAGVINQYNFLSGVEQTNLLIESGFTDVSTPVHVFSNQAIMNIAHKKA